MAEIDPVVKSLEDGLGKVNDYIKNQTEKLETELVTLQSKMSEQAKLTGDVEQGLKEKHAEFEKTLISLKERQDAYEKQAGRLSGGRGESFQSAIEKALQGKSEALKSYKDNRKPVNIELNEKTAVDMTQSASLEDLVIPPTRVEGVKFDPERQFRMRQVVPVGSTNSNAIYYVEETTYEDGVNVTAEGDEKPQSSFKLEQKSANVTKIATHFKVSEEMIDDIPYLASHISLRGTQKYLNKEDKQVLYGTGLSNQLAGLTGTATAYTMNQYTDTKAQEWDVLIEAIKQIRKRNFAPTAALMDTDRYFDMVRTKDDDGRYIMPESVVFGTARPVVLGTPIIATNALEDNDFIVADFPMLATLFDRKGINIRFFDQNEDDAIKNFVTVVIEGRLALPTYLPNAGCFGSFTAAIKNAGNS